MMPPFAPFPEDMDLPHLLEWIRRAAPEMERAGLSRPKNIATRRLELGAPLALGIAAAIPEAEVMFFRAGIPDDVLQNTPHQGVPSVRTAFIAHLCGHLVDADGVVEPQVLVDLVVGDLIRSLEVSGNSALIAHIQCEVGPIDPGHLENLKTKLAMMSAPVAESLSNYRTSHRQALALDATTVPVGQSPAPLRF